MGTINQLFCSVHQKSICVVLRGMCGIGVGVDMIDSNSVVSVGGSRCTIDIQGRAWRQGNFSAHLQALVGTERAHQ